MTHGSIPIRPPPPRAPAAFTQEWANELNRWLQSLSDAQAGFVYARLSGMYWPDPHTSGYGLRAGEIFSNGGVLTVVQEGDIWMGGVAASTRLGTLTVTV